MVVDIFLYCYNKLTSDGGHRSERSAVMDVIIGLVISALGAHFYKIDFCTLFTFISIALALYQNCVN